jgi:sulfur carrier protein
LKIKFSEDRVENLNLNRISLEDLLLNLGIDPLEVIVKKDGSIILDDEMIDDTDCIEIIKVIHGG